MLVGFADQIEDASVQQAFQQLIRKVPFYRERGLPVEHCNHAHIEQLGVQLHIEDLTEEFFQRYQEFVSHQDLDSIAEPITPENIAEFARSITPAISDEQLECN